MRTLRVWSAWILVGLCILVAGGLSASNRGFKLVYDFVEASGGSSGTNPLAIPYLPKLGMETAKDLFRDIADQGGDVQNIQRYLTATDSFDAYGFGSTDFDLVPGEGYLAKVPNGIEYRILGSHDPSVALQLLGPEDPNSQTGFHLIGLPFHSLSSSASELFQEIGAGNVQQIQKYLPQDDTYQIYTFGSTDFSIARGEAVLLKMEKTTTFSPAHY